MKIYARQLPPDQCDASFFFDDDYYREFISIAGNERCGDMFPDRVNVAKRYCDDMTYDQGPEVIFDKNGKPFSDEAMKRLKDITQDGSLAFSEAEEEFILEYLSDYHGEPYKKVLIRGCCQGDWNYLYVPERMSQRDIDFIEACYFNTGTELIIQDTDHEPACPEEIDGYSMYVPEVLESDIKRVIADEYGISSDDVVLYAFDGYERVPKYREF